MKTELSLVGHRVPRVDAVKLVPNHRRVVAGDVGGGHDAEEPRTDVRARFEALEGAVLAQHRLLEQVFGIGRVPGHPERGAGLLPARGGRSARCAVARLPCHRGTVARMDRSSMLG